MRAAQDLSKSSLRAQVGSVRETSATCDLLGTLTSLFCDGLFNTFESTKVFSKVFVHAHACVVIDLHLYIILASTQFQQRPK